MGDEEIGVRCLPSFIALRPDEMPSAALNALDVTLRTRGNPFFVIGIVFLGREDGERTLPFR
jgi:hypothetical protein